MKHDYATAREKFIETCQGEIEGKTLYFDLPKDVQDTIIHALRFAEKMMQEPSKGMRIAADNCLSSNKAALKKLSVREVNETFKSMRDAALKELGE